MEIDREMQRAQLVREQAAAQVAVARLVRRQCRESVEALHRSRSQTPTAAPPRVG